MCPANSFNSKFETFLSSNVSNWFNWLLFSGTALTRLRKVRMVCIQCADILNYFTMMTSPTLHDEAQRTIDVVNDAHLMSVLLADLPQNTQSLKFGNKKQSATCLRCFAALIPPLISNSFWSSRSYGHTWAGSVLWCSDLNWGVVRLAGQGQNRLGKVQRWGSNWKKTITLYGLFGLYNATSLRPLPLWMNAQKIQSGLYDQVISM